MAVMTNCSLVSKRIACVTPIRDEHFAVRLWGYGNDRAIDVSPWIKRSIEGSVWVQTGEAFSRAAVDRNREISTYQDLPVR